MPKFLESEAEIILHTLASTPFEDCIAISKEFRELPMTAGIYAVKHYTLGILYIGKTRTLRDRFRGGHKALLIHRRVKSHKYPNCFLSLGLHTVVTAIIRTRTFNYSSS